MTREPPRAVLLVGGKGTRLHPFTVSFPKALMPLGDVPILDVLIRQLAGAGITRITLAVGHLAELIQAYVDQRGLRSVADIDFVYERTPLGTAGALGLVDGLDHTFMTLNGDVLTDLDFSALLEFHRARGGILTVATHDRQVRVDLGVLESDADDVVVAYREKPVFDFRVSMGVYVYEPQVRDFIMPGEAIDFPDLVLRLLDAGEKVVSFEAACTWLDIGRPDDYAAAQELYATGQWRDA